MTVTRPSPHELVGFEVHGRNGLLGVVEGIARRPAADGSVDLLVLGGASSLLRFHVPMWRVVHVSAVDLVLEIEADVVDFAPRPTLDGTIELYLEESAPRPKGR